MYSFIGARVTLVVADLFFSFPAETRGWPRFFVRHVMRLPRLFGISAFYRRLIIENKQAFARSMEALLELDCDWLIVAHWKPSKRKRNAFLNKPLLSTEIARLSELLPM